MAKIKAYKVLSNLPSTLEPDSVYLVRSGLGFDHYVTDSTGAVAHPQNPGFQIRGGGRVYCYTDLRWIALHDDDFGPSTDNLNEAAGYGTDPTYEYEHAGDIIKAGTKINFMDIYGSVNASVTDMEIDVVLRTAKAPDNYETGINSDTEVDIIPLYRDFFMASTTGTAYTGLLTHRRSRTITINHTAAADSELLIYMRPVGDYSATRYFRTTYFIY